MFLYVSSNRVRINLHPIRVNGRLHPIHPASTGTTGGVCHPAVTGITGGGDEALACSDTILRTDSTVNASNLNKWILNQ